MSVLLLHETNIFALKASLRTRLPTVRSGHLTEALAAGLGYKTHAALRAGMDADAERSPDIAETHDGEFAGRLVSFGYDAPPVGLLGDLVRSPAIPDRPYAEFRDGDRRANDAHYAACMRLGRPMMMVRMARTYAKLDWDIITLTISDIKRIYGDEEGTSFSLTMFERFRWFATGSPGKPEFTGGPSTGWVTKLLPDVARALAEEYFCMLYLPMRRFARRSS